MLPIQWFFFFKIYMENVKNKIIFKMVLKLSSPFLKVMWVSHLTTKQGNAKRYEVSNHLYLGSWWITPIEAEFLKHAFNKLVTRQLELSAAVLLKKSTGVCNSFIKMFSNTLDKEQLMIKLFLFYRFLFPKLYKHWKTFLFLHFSYW